MHNLTQKMESIGSHSANTPSLLPFFSNDDLQYICELLTCDPSSPHADDPHNVSTPQIQSMPNTLNLAHNPPSLPLHHPISPHSLLSSPVNHIPHFSPNLTSLHALPTSPIAGSAKRDWLSSLSPFSPSFSPSTSAPTGPIIAPSTQNLQNCKTLQKLRHHELHLNPGLSHIKIRQSKEEASGKQCDGDDDSQPKAQGSMLGANAYGVALRLSDVNAALQAMPIDDDSQPQVQGSVLGANAYGVALRLSDVKGALQAMLSYDNSQAKARGSMVGANAYSVALRLSDVKAALQATPFDNDSQPKLQGSMVGANAHGVALRLSDVKAALQAIPFDDDSQTEVRGSRLGANAYSVALCLSDVKAALQEMPFDSHLSISANASLSHPTSSLSSSTSADPCTWTTSGMNQTINSALITSCSLNTSTGIPTNVDEWLNKSGTDVLRNTESGRRESKNNKKTQKLERVPSKMINQDTMSNGAMQEYTRKAHIEYEELARRKGILICSERERRQGMRDLYGTLRSLLPDGMTKVSSCCKLNSSDLQERIITFVGSTQESHSQAKEPPLR